MFIALLVVKIIAIAMMVYGGYGVFKRYRHEISGGTVWDGKPLRSKPTRISVEMGRNAVRHYAAFEGGIIILAAIGIFA